jgi:c-di-GMP-binding flagellar brake protein YcgR
MDKGFWESADRRRYQRLKMNLMVVFKVQSPQQACEVTRDKEVEANLLDLSLGGMALVTKYNIPVWSKLLIKFYMFKTDNSGGVTFSDPVELLGEVRSNVMSNYNEYRLGVCFKNEL